jgi:hypothetical protein
MDLLMHQQGSIRRGGTAVFVAQPCWVTFPDELARGLAVVERSPLARCFTMPARAVQGALGPMAVREPCGVYIGAGTNRIFDDLRARKIIPTH